MTYIHSNHRTFDTLNLVLAGLIFTALVGVFWLVALYNNVVNVSHNISLAKAKLDTVGAENTTLNSQVAAALSSAATGNLANSDGLIEDNNPQYFQQPIATNPSPAWPLASQQ